jgi:hypothetical protein
VIHTKREALVTGAGSFSSMRSPPGSKPATRTSRWSVPTHHHSAS